MIAWNLSTPRQYYHAWFGAGNRHIHLLIYNPYNFSLYCVVGEVETVFKSSDGGDTWIDLDIRVEDTKATAMIAVPDGVIMASDGNR